MRTIATVSELLGDLGMRPLKMPLLVAIQQWATQGYRLRHGTNPMAQVNESGLNVRVFDADNADLVYQAAHVIFGREFAKTADLRYGEWADRLSGHAPQGCNCYICALAVNELDNPSQFWDDVPLDDLTRDYHYRLFVRGVKQPIYCGFSDFKSQRSLDGRRRMLVTFIRDDGRLVRVPSRAVRRIERIP